MCGIFGSTKLYSDDVMREKLNSMHHRGPDYSGFERFNEQVVFGHNRLSIIDLDPRSHQPMVYQHLSIVFNGEIYNFQEVREVLKQKGYEFRSLSDTEVILAAYLAYGEECPKHFNGMFAFVIFDPQKQLLFGARDRFGVKPFYYTTVNGAFEFSSVLNPIVIGNEFSMDNDSISKYLTWGYIGEPFSIYKDIQKLRCGYTFTYDLQTKTFKDQPFYELGSQKPKFEGSIEEAMNELDVLFKAAVKRRMIADVPLGVFLSGGIDSSLVAAYASEVSAEPLKTFAIQFNEKGFDESQYAAEIAKYLGTNHTTIACDYEEGLKLIEGFSHFYDEPFSDSSAIPSMLLSKHTKEHVTVALSGDAGDEPFLGYNMYSWMKKVEPLFAMPYLLRYSGAAIAEILPHYRLKLIGMGLKKKNLGELYKASVSTMDNNLLLNPSLGNYNEYGQYLESKKEWIDKYSDFDIKTYLTGDINVKVDRASMAYSLEVRAPFLDYTIVDFAKSLPVNFRYNNGSKKFILKELLAKKVPKEMFDRPKQGFGVPIGTWFKGPLKEMVLEKLSRTNLERIPNLNIDFMLKQVDDHLDGTANNVTRIWRVLVLLEWLDHHQTAKKHA